MLDWFWTPHWCRIWILSSHQLVSTTESQLSKESATFLNESENFFFEKKNLWTRLFFMTSPQLVVVRNMLYVKRGKCTVHDTCDLQSSHINLEVTFCCKSHFRDDFTNSKSNFFPYVEKMIWRRKRQKIVRFWLGNRWFMMKLVDQIL